jgi:hypothetical protein
MAGGRKSMGRPSLRVSGLALVLALSLVAAGPGTSGASARAASDPADFFAVVNADGTLARGTPGTSVIHMGTGLYNISFPESLAGCAAVANLGYAGTSEEFTFSSVVTVSLSGNRALVDVTYPGDTTAGFYPHSPVLGDNSFDIHVDCGHALSAVVDANGSLATGSPGVKTSGHPVAPGKYEVGFGREISKCAPVATVQDGPGRSAFSAQAHLALGADSRSLTVWVNTASREPVDWGFDVIVTCGQQPPAQVFPVSEGYGNQMTVPSALSCAFTASWYYPAPGSKPSDQGYVSTWATSTTTATVQTKNGGYGVTPGYGVDLVATCPSNKPVTTPPQTETVTVASTVTQTQTVTTAATTTSTSHHGAAAAVGAAAAKEEQSESGGLPGWAWVLIGAAAAGLIIWGVTAIRKRRRSGSGPASTGKPPSGPAAP